MKFAVSSYSLSSLVNKGLKTEIELISLAKERSWGIKVRKKNRLGTGHIYEELEA